MNDPDPAEPASSDEPGRDPARDYELLRSLEEAAASAKEQRKKAEWLVTLIAGDGAQRIERWRGALPDRIETALHGPIRPLLTGDQWPPSGLRTRMYVLERFDWSTGQATYREEIR